MLDSVQLDVRSQEQVAPPSFTLKHVLKVPRVVFLLCLCFFQSFSDAYYASTFITEI